MKNGLLLIICLIFFYSAKSQEFSVKRIQIKNPNTNSWDELMTFSKLNINVLESKNIVFYDYNLRMVEILAGKEYVGGYDNVSFTNSGLESKDANKGIYGYTGFINLSGKNNFTIKKEAYVSLMYYPGSNKLGMIEIGNKLCMCYIRFWLN